MERPRHFDYKADATAIVTAAKTDCDRLPVDMLQMRVRTGSVISGRTAKFLYDELDKGRIAGNRIGRSWRISTIPFLRQLGIID